MLSTDGIKLQNKKLLSKEHIYRRLVPLRKNNVNAIELNTSYHFQFIMSKRNYNENANKIEMEEKGSVRRLGH